MADFKPVKMSRQGPGSVQRTGPKVTKPAPTSHGKPVPEYKPLEPARPSKREDITFEAPNHRLPEGWIWMWNRLGKQWEYPFDNKPQIFKPFEFKPVTTELADFLYAHCIISYDPEAVDGVVRTLAVEGDSGWCIPLDDPTNVELIDRTDDDNPIGWGTGGEETEVVVMKVPGAGTERHRGTPNWGRTSSKAIRKVER